MFKTLLDNLGTILGVFAILNFFKFFKNISKTRPSLEHWAKKFSRKNYPKNMFKTRLDTFRNDFDHFWNFAKFLIFWNHFEDSSLHGTLRKKNFRKKYPKTCSKYVWTIWELLRAFLEFWNFLKLFKNISKTRPSMDYCAKKFSKKIPQNVFKIRLDNLGTILGVFWILNFFKKNFEDSTLLGTLGKKNFSKKLPQNMFKTRLDTFRSDFDLFWNFANFLKTFRRLDPPWNTGQKNFSKKLPQNMFKTCLDKLGTILGVFSILKVFWFFENISNTRPSMEHWAKRNFRKKYPETCSKHFWTIWERF